MKRVIVSACALSLLLTAATTLNAQVSFRGAGTPEVDRWLIDFLHGSDYRLITNDTLLDGDPVEGSILVLGARLTLATRVRGHVVGVEANLFLRPSARVEGDVWNLAGGLYPSSLAEVDGTVHDLPLAPYRARSEDGVWLVEAVEREGDLVLHGFRGVGLPTYDRVSGLSIPLRASFHPPNLGVLRPRVTAHVTYREARGRLDGGAEAALLRGATELTLGAERATITNERWIAGDVRNTLRTLFNRGDLRDYYAVDRLYGTLAHELVTGRWRVVPALGVQWEEASPLAERRVWALFAPDTARANIQVDDGVVRSALAGAEFEWASEHSAFVGSLELELGSPAQGHDFARFALLGDWAAEALFGHGLEVRWHFRGPIGGKRAPPFRRWSFVGGPLTLPTFEVADMRGDRLAFVETTYLIPLPEGWSVRILGRPELLLSHAFGGAWPTGAARELEQNVGVGVRFAFVQAVGVVNPADSGRVVAAFALRVPF